MGKILVTGHKGFIGSRVFWTLRSKGIDVHGIDKKDGDSIKESLLLNDDFDAVVHCAANLFGNFEENIESTKLLVHEFAASRFIFLSSAAVYGNCYDAKESDKGYPFGKYGQSKYLEEVEVSALNNHAIFRLSNVYGYDTDHGFHNKCLYGNPKLNYADHVRDYVHVNDVVSAIVHAALDSENSNYDGIYNLSTGVGTTNYDLYKKLRPFDSAIVADEGVDEIAVSVLNPGKAVKNGFHPRSL